MNTNTIQELSYKKGKYFVVVNGIQYILNDIIYGRVLPYSGKDLSNYQMIEIEAFNYAPLDKGIKKLINNSFCEFDFYLYLKKIDVLPEHIKVIMRVLKQESIIDNRRYAKCVKETMQHKKGKRAFKNFLTLKKIDQVIIDSLLENYQEDINIAMKIANRYVNMNKYSTLMLKQKIKAALLNKGFCLETINEVIDSIKYDESIALKKYLNKIDINNKKEYEKLIRAGFHIERRYLDED